MGWTRFDNGTEPAWKFDGFTIYKGKKAFAGGATETRWQLFDGVVFVDWFWKLKEAKAHAEKMKNANPV